MGNQIILFIIVAAAVGFGVGWIMRGQQAASAAPRKGGIPATSGAAADDERERLRVELAAARDEHTRLESAVAEAQSLADTRAARVRELEGELQSRERPSNAGDGEGGTAEEEGTPPEATTPPEGTPDDLKQISGIGPQIEKTLHELGIYRFQQIATFTPENVAWVNRRLRFKGRIEREDWIGQAKKLAAAQAE